MILQGTLYCSWWEEAGFKFYPQRRTRVQRVVWREIQIFETVPMCDCQGRKGCGCYRLALGLWRSTSCSPTFPQELLSHPFPSSSSWLSARGHSLSCSVAGGSLVCTHLRRKAGAGSAPGQRSLPPRSVSPPPWTCSLVGLTPSLQVSLTCETCDAWLVQRARPVSLNSNKCSL